MICGMLSPFNDAHGPCDLPAGHWERDKTLHRFIVYLSPEASRNLALLLVKNNARIAFQAEANGLTFEEQGARNAREYVERMRRKIR